MKELTDFLRMHILVRGIIYAIMFYVIETFFRRVFPNQEGSDTNLRFHGRSTITMMPGATLCGLYFIEPFYHFCRPFSDFYANIGLRLILWPFVIWMFEILWAGYLFYHCNQSRAWYYEGKGACLNGFIKLTYYGWWFLFGIAVEAGYYYIGL